jgi:hypothetical protein
LIKAADMLIARRADTKARADFATWKMMAKLNGGSALPAEAQKFLGSYQALLNQMPEREATDATISLLYKSYYGEMGGSGAAPDIRIHSSDPAADNVTAFKRPAVQKPKIANKITSRTASGLEAKPRLPVALIFACLVVVYVGFRYFMQ